MQRSRRPQPLFPALAWARTSFINGYERWCLWLGDCPPDRAAQDARSNEAQWRRCERIRLASKSAPTRKLAATPTRFHVENMPSMRLSGNSRSVIRAAHLYSHRFHAAGNTCAAIWFTSFRMQRSTISASSPRPCTMAWMRYSLRAAEKRLSLLGGHRLQQLPLAGTPHRQTASRPSKPPPGPCSTPAPISRILPGRPLRSA